MRFFRTEAIVVAMFIAACFVCSAAAQSDRTYKHVEGGIQFTAPDKWKVESDGDVINVVSPDESMAIIFIVLDASSLEEGVNALTSELDKVIKEPKIPSEGKETSINGLKAYYVEGSGKVEETPVEFGVMLIAGKKPVMVIAMSGVSDFSKHEKDAAALMNSIRPVT